MNGMETKSGLRTDFIGTALFYGAAWGLGEATLGHLLHMARVPGLPGLVMVPFAVLVMGRALARSPRADAVFLTGMVAASFKLLDLLMPGTDLLALVNPIQAILLEALAATVWVRLKTVPKMGTLLFLKSGRLEKIETSPFSS